MIADCLFLEKGVCTWILGTLEAPFGRGVRRREVLADGRVGSSGDWAAAVLIFSWDIGRSI
jgi:hypothetical protein